MHENDGNLIKDFTLSFYLSLGTPYLIYCWIEMLSCFTLGWLCYKSLKNVKHDFIYYYIMVFGQDYFV